MQPRCRRERSHVHRSRSCDAWRARPRHQTAPISRTPRQPDQGRTSSDSRAPFARCSHDSPPASGRCAANAVPNRKPMPDSNRGRCWKRGAGAIMLRAVQAVPLPGVRVNDEAAADAGNRCPPQHVHSSVCYAREVGRGRSARSIATPGLDSAHGTQRHPRRERG